MSYFYKIQNADDKWYNDFIKIYAVSFPVYEQRNHEQQLDAFRDERYNLFCQIGQEMVNSFISFWDFGEYVYIEHLAVNEKLRGKNIGTEMLTQFIEEINKTVILEIDPIIDEVSAKRLQFYQKIGFNMNEYKHVHPAYNPQYPPHQLLVLSTGNTLTPQRYNIFKNDLEKIVMKQ